MITLEKPLVCPHCHAVKPYVHNTMGDKGPQEGDIDVCGECAEVAFYDENLQLRSPTYEDWQSLSAVERMQIAMGQSAARQMKAARNG